MGGNSFVITSGKFCNAMRYGKISSFRSQNKVQTLCSHNRLYYSKFHSRRQRRKMTSLCVYSSINSSTQSDNYSSYSSFLKRHLPGPLPKPPDSSTSTFLDVCAWLFKITFVESEQEQNGSKEHKSNPFWLRYENQLRIFAAFFLSATSKLSGLAVPLLFRYGIEVLERESNVMYGNDRATFSLANVLAGSDNCGGVYLFGIVLILSGICRAVSSICGELRSVVFQPVAQTTGRSVAINTYRHIMDLDIGFHVERNIGKLSRIVDRGTRSVAMVFRAILFTFLPTIIELVLVCVLLWRSFSPLCCGVVLMTFTLYTIFTANVSYRAAIIRKQVNFFDNLCSGKVVDSLMQVEVVKNFDNINFETNDYNNLLVDYQVESQKSERNSATLNAGQAIILSIGVTLVLLIVVNSQAISPSLGSTPSIVGGIVMANGLLLQISAPLQFLGYFYRELRQSLVDIHDVFDILNMKTKVPEGKEELDPLSLKEVNDQNINNEMSNKSKGVSLRVSDAWFSYLGRDPVLKGVSIEAKSGESIALVGPSGSGKSTLLRLIMRQYDAEEGMITLDGIDIRSLTNTSLRDAIGVVPQESALFTGTLESNIRYGSNRNVDGNIEMNDAEADALMAAVRLSQLEGVLDNAPAGLQTIVGNRGFKLSGGERQRVALARVFLRHPRLLLCDEATSALDSNTEKMILKAIRDISKGRTCVTVAHRLSTIVDSDRIYVMRDGIVEEFGTHEELLACATSRPESDGRNFTGLYKHLWQLQQKETDVEEAALLAM